MRIALINPPLFYYMRIAYTYNPTVGLPTLGAVLEKAGHEVEIVDAEALQWAPERVAAYVAGYQFDGVGVTGCTMSRKGAQETVAALREAMPDLYIAVGGVHATLNPQEPLAWGADCTVTGEAENGVCAVFEVQPKGVVSCRTPVDMESLPAPAWHQLALKPINTYPGNSPKLGHPEGILMTARGCPHHCVFCGNALFSPRPWRPRPVANVVDELEVLRKRWGVNSVFIYDDEFIGMNARQQGWLQEFAAQVKRRNLHRGLTIKAQGRCSKRFVDIDTLRELRSACDALCIMWGVESFSDHVLRAIKKGTTTDMIWHTLFTAKRADILNWLFLMVGNLEETADDAELTVLSLRKALDHHLVDFRQVTICSPQPGTEMWARAEKEGWLVEQPLTGAAMHEAYGPTPWLSVEQMRHYQSVLEAMR